MSDAAPWENDPIDTSARPLTVRSAAPRGALPASGAQPQAVTGAGSGDDDAPWANDPIDHTAGSSWLGAAADIAQSAATGLEKGAIGLATAPVAISDAGRWLVGQALDNVLGPKPQVPDTPLHDLATNTADYLGPSGMTRGVEALAGPMYQPQTTAGRYAETAGEFVPGAAGGGAGNLIKFGVLPGLASEAAGQATQGSALELYARVAAPILAGGVGALAGGPGSAGNVLRDAAGALDRPTLDAAQQLMDAAAQQGTPLSLSEAVQQVTNSGTRLGAVQRVVEQSRGGAEPMGRFYAGRPGQVQTAGNAAIDRIGPVPSAPSAVGPAVQQAAQGVVGDAHAARTAMASPFYQRAASDNVPADAIGGILEDIDGQIAADKTGLLAGPLGEFRSRLIDRTAKKPGQWEPDPAGGGQPAGQPDRPFAPPEEYQPPARGMRPTVPRPTSLVSFLQQAGGVRDLGGDMKAAGLDRFPGLVRAKNGQYGVGLKPDQARQAAAQAGYLGADVNRAMAETTINDLFDALDRHPAYSVHDDDAVHAWEAYDNHIADRSRTTGPTSRPAAPVHAPGLPDGGPGLPAEAPPTPITDIANLDRTRKFFRDRIDLPQFADKAIDKETGARVARVLGSLDSAMEAASSSYAAGKQAYQQASRDIVDPIEQGMIGALSRSADFGAQARIVLGENPLPGSASEVAAAVTVIKAKAPDAARALVSQRIRQVFNEATQSNMGGPNHWGGAKFAAVIQGNTQQARNLKAAVEALQGPGVWRDFQRTLDVFEAMGRRQAPGSQTEFNKQISREMQKGGVVGQAVATGASPAAWLTKAKDIYDGWRYGRNTAALAAFLTRPDAAKALAAIAKHPPGSSASQGAAALYLLNTASNQRGKPIAK